MLIDAAKALACPYCQQPLHIAEKTAECADGHSFDIARQGYLNLLRGDVQVHTADTAEMVSARERFLESGAFSPIRESAVGVFERHIDDATPGVIVDVGAGTGWLLGALLDAKPHRAGVALDVSKYAARAASSAHPRVASIVADAWGRLPLADSCACAVVSFFAPRNAAEFRRILAPGGVALIITPAPDHLEGLVAPLGLVSIEPDKASRLERAFGEDFRLAETIPVRHVTQLTRAQAREAAKMGPSSHHADAATLESALAALPEPQVVTISVELRIFEPVS